MSLRVLKGIVDVVQQEIKPPISKKYKKKLRKRKSARKFNIQGTEVQNGRTERLDKRKLSKNKHQERFPELKEVSFQVEGS